MAGIITEPFWKKMWRKKRIAELRKNIEDAKKNDDFAMVTRYEIELMMLQAEDHAVY